MAASVESDPSGVNGSSTPIADYGGGKLILAPMVRQGTLPFRLQALRHGCDIAFSEELIALKLRLCERRFDPVHCVTEFIPMPKQQQRSGGVQKSNAPSSGGQQQQHNRGKGKARARELTGGGDPTVVFSTCIRDHPNVLQLGAADAVVALQAAQVVSRDVDGIDLNMGCPKHFSVQGGMGAALLGEDPVTAYDILSTLRRNLNNSVTCKVRLLENDADMKRTIEMLRRLEHSGVRAITVHTRLVSERPHEPAHWPCMKTLVERANLQIPLLVNGDVYTAQDVTEVLETTGASSVMIARGAQRNVSVFGAAKQGTPLIPVFDVCREFVQIATETNNNFGNTKWCAFQTASMSNSKALRMFVESVQATKSYEELCGLYNLTEFWAEHRSVPGLKPEMPTTLPPAETINTEASSAVGSANREAVDAVDTQVRITETAPAPLSKRART